jgi:rod shape-determining protein MreC
MYKLLLLISRHRVDFLAFCLLVLSLIFIIIDSRDKFATTRKITITIFSPFQKAISYIKQIDNLKNENTELRKQVVNLSLQNELFKEMKLENERLKKLLLFEEENKSSMKLIPVQIIAIKGDRLPNSIIVNKGEKSGLKIHMPAITVDGLVGKIIDVQPNTATIQLLLDRDCRVSVMNQRSRIIGIYEWSSKSKGIIKDVPLRADVKIGDKLITSGLGGVFPKGISVGTISEVKHDPLGLFYQIDVELTVDFSKLEEIFVVSQ